ncbi:proteasome beta 6 subunit [Trypanosoma rangeli]|uniref:Proteasome subunit beta n=1 Tax=Trypanosoma rangeli TaxID=5698 RepID=A0A3R7KX47_TRYRA|nr:proteasome beta 6 subunit [Trypanosoma rangeli]RNF03117.1 proteasome beta 6 subunit [Trypanosoma rangeli]|eukprot:RNF03117.1 proteasome beta 6 subunit [Trypanosoma rangeli]
MIEDHMEYKYCHPKKLADSTLTLPRQGVKEQQWSPYADNGGTIAAIAGSNYVILGGDTRLNGDFCIHTRDDRSKLFQLTERTFLASTGMQADRLQLQQMLKYRIQWYQYNNGGKVPSTKAIAKLTSTMLYQRRFFPYYTFNMIAGLDETGAGVCYSYDPVGSTEPFRYGTSGSASSFVEPLMDCLLTRQHMVRQVPAELSMEETLEMLKNAFTGAAERDIFTGDAVCFHIIKADGIWTELFELRKD